MSTPTQTISLSGFDPAGEPEIRLMADGTLYVVFNFMPPSNLKDAEDDFFNHFREHMQHAIDVPVVHEDRELFLIPSPTDDTIERVRSFVQRCRRDLRRGSPRVTQQSVRGALYEGLGSIVTARGFWLSKKRQGFVRAIPGGRQILFLSWVDYRPRYEFSLTLGIRLEAVEAIVNQFSGALPCDRADTLTTLTQLEYFGLEPEPGRGVLFRVSTPDDAAAALRQLTPLLEERILPFFDRYQDVRSVDEGLHSGTAPTGAEGAARGAFWPRLKRIAAKLRRSSDAETPEEAWARWTQDRRAFNTSSHPYRGMRNLVTAYLAGSPHVEALARRYRSDMEMAADPDKQKFESLLEYLHAQKRRGRS